jgi:hypothetical protein
METFSMGSAITAIFQKLGPILVIAIPIGLGGPGSTCEPLPGKLKQEVLHFWILIDKGSSLVLISILM